MDAATESALKSSSAALGGEFSGALAALRDSLRRSESHDKSFAATLLRHASNEDAAKIIAALMALEQLRPIFSDAALAAHRFESERNTASTPVAPAPIDAGKLSSIEPRAPFPITRDSVVAVVKVPDVEQDMKQLGVGIEELRKIYAARDPEAVQALFDSYERQKTALEELKRHVKPEQIILSCTLKENRERLAGAGAVISFGGDDQIKLVSHYVPSRVPIVGVNNDPVLSHGKLLAFWDKDLAEVLDRLERADYRLAPWTQIKVELDGTPIPDSLDSVFLGHAYRKRMSRHILTKVDADGNETLHVRQKGSGILVSTGAGSTGWFNSEIWPLYRRETSWDHEAPYARYFNTGASASNGGAAERNDEALKMPDHTEGILYPGEQLVIHSLNRGEGIVSTDSFEEFPFVRGSTATVSVDPEPRWMVSRG